MAPLFDRLTAEPDLCNQVGFNAIPAVRKWAFCRICNSTKNCRRFQRYKPSKLKYFSLPDFILRNLVYFCVKKKSLQNRPTFALLKYHISIDVKLNYLEHECFEWPMWFHTNRKRPQKNPDTNGLFTLRESFFRTAHTRGSKNALKNRDSERDDELNFNFVTRRFQTSRQRPQKNPTRTVFLTLRESFFRTRTHARKQKCI